MRSRRGGRILIPAAVLMLAAWGCQGPATQPDTVHAPAVATQMLAAGTSTALVQDSTAQPSQNLTPRAPESVCSFASADLPNADVHVGLGPIIPLDEASGGPVQKVEAVGEVTRVTVVPPEPSVSADPPVANATPSIILSLDQAIATGLEQNPSLVALRATQPIADAAVQVSKVYPFNPYVQVELCPLDRDITGVQAATLNYAFLMQTLELAHQQRFREASATASRNQVAWNVVQAELVNAAQSERLYFTALYQRDLRDLAKLTASLNDQLLGVVQRRFKAGMGAPAEQATATVAARQSRKQAGLTEANFQTALLALKRQLNLDSTQPISLLGRLEDFTWLPIDGVEPDGPNNVGPIQVSQEVVAKLASERPDVLAAHAGTSIAQANADLARANMVQNIQVGPFYERDDFGTLFVGFRAQMNLPIWDSGRPLANQRVAEATHQTTVAQQLCAQAQVEAQTAIERYERARRLVTRERVDFAHMMPEQIERVRHQFDAGLVDILYVFTIQNNLLQERKTYLDLLNEVAQAAADVTLAGGLPPSRVVDGHSNASPPPAAPPAQ
jgi:cobalt-zinc-cadmium efflux system outer membrane protein